MSVKDLPYSKTHGTISVTIEDERVLLIFPRDFGKGMKFTILATLINALAPFLRGTRLYIGRRGNPVIALPLRVTAVAATEPMRRAEAALAQQMLEATAAHARGGVDPKPDASG